MRVEFEVIANPDSITPSANHQVYRDDDARIILLYTAVVPVELYNLVVGDLLSSVYNSTLTYDIKPEDVRAIYYNQSGREIDFNPKYGSIMAFCEEVKIDDLDDDQYDSLPQDYFDTRYIPVDIVKAYRW